MRKVYGLDLIRFVCAAWVVFGHLVPSIDTSTAIGQLAKSTYAVSFSGASAVIIFFVISGFCIHYPHRDGRPVDLSSYYLRRYLRIGIPMVVAIILHQFPNLTSFNLHFFQQSVLWSLQCELVYYTIYPTLLLIKNKFGWAKLLISSFILSYAIIIILNARAGDYASYGIAFNWVLGLPCWLLGCRLAEKSDGLTASDVSNIWNWRLAVWLVSCFCLLLRFHSPIGYPYTLNLFAILVVFWLQKEIAYFRLFDHSNKTFLLLEWLGTWSYSIYLVHIPASNFFEAYLSLPQLGYFLNWISLLLFVLTASYLFYILVEKPSHRLARRFRRKESILG